MKGRGLCLRNEIRSGQEYARAKRFRALWSALWAYDWPHGHRPERTWKRHRRAKYLEKVRYWMREQVSKG
jgi:hypothetical protein